MDPLAFKDARELLLSLLKKNAKLIRLCRSRFEELARRNGCSPAVILEMARMLNHCLGNQVVDRFEKIAADGVEAEAVRWRALLQLLEEDGQALTLAFAACSSTGASLDFAGDVAKLEPARRNEVCDYACRLGLLREVHGEDARLAMPPLPRLVLRRESSFSKAADQHVQELPHRLGSRDVRSARECLGEVLSASEWLRHKGQFDGACAMVHAGMKAILYLTLVEKHSVEKTFAELDGTTDPDRTPLALALRYFRNRVRLAHLSGKHEDARAARREVLRTRAGHLGGSCVP